jgi:hypothetical protein
MVSRRILRDAVGATVGDTDRSVCPCKWPRQSNDERVGGTEKRTDVGTVEERVGILDCVG